MILKRVESLQKELEDANNQIRELAHIHKTRSNTVYASDDQLSGRVRELETELNAMKTKNDSLNNHIVELNAQIMKMNMDAGSKFIVNLTTTNNSIHHGPSLADELGKMSNEELMEKLKSEEQATQRLKEYIDNILTRIMEHSPQLLEYCLQKY